MSAVAAANFTSIILLSPPGGLTIQWSRPTYWSLCNTHTLPFCWVPAVTQQFTENVISKLSQHINRHDITLSTCNVTAKKNCCLSVKRDSAVLHSKYHSIICSITDAVDSWYYFLQYFYPEADSWYLFSRFLNGHPAQSSSRLTPSGSSVADCCTSHAETTGGATHYDESLQENGTLMLQQYELPLP